MNSDIFLTYLRLRIAKLNGRLYTTEAGNLAASLRGCHYLLQAENVGNLSQRIPELIASEMRGERRKVA